MLLVYAAATEAAFDLRVSFHQEAIVKTKGETMNSMKPIWEVGPHKST